MGALLPDDGSAVARRTLCDLSGVALRNALRRRAGGHPARCSSWWRPRRPARATPPRRYRRSPGACIARAPRASRCRRAIATEVWRRAGARAFGAVWSPDRMPAVLDRPKARRPERSRPRRRGATRARARGPRPPCRRRPRRARADAVAPPLGAYIALAARLAVARRRAGPGARQLGRRTAIRRSRCMHCCPRSADLGPPARLIVLPSRRATAASPRLALCAASAVLTKSAAFGAHLSPRDSGIW